MRLGFSLFASCKNSLNSHGRPFDIVVFGASGFTGKLLVEELAKRGSQKGIRWAVAGRSEEKLKRTLADVSVLRGHDFSGVPTIVANVHDAKSLARMAASTDVVLSAVGPYRFWGESVIQACLAEGSNHIDISGEPHFLESMQLKYWDEAKSKGLYLIGACGLDSVPADMGLLFLLDHCCDFDLHSVTHLVKIEAGDLGFGIHAATLTSALHSYAHSDEMKQTRRELTSRFPSLKSPFSSRQKSPVSPRLISKDASRSTWNLKSAGADKSVMLRSLRHLTTNDASFKHGDFTLDSYVSFESLWNCLVTVGVAMGIVLLGNFRLTRNLIIKNPGFFTLGFFTDAGPNRDQQESSIIRQTFIARGWRKNDGRSGPPQELVTAEVISPDSGYLTTASCAVCSAMTVNREKQFLPNGGGVFTPGAAFKNTTLMKELQAGGMVFQILKEADIGTPAVCSRTH